MKTKTIRFLQNAQRHGEPIFRGNTKTWDEETADAYVAAGQAVVVPEATVSEPHAVETPSVEKPESEPVQADKPVADDKPNKRRK